MTDLTKYYLKRILECITIAALILGVGAAYMTKNWITGTAYIWAISLSIQLHDRKKSEDFENFLNDEEHD